MIIEIVVKTDYGLVLNRFAINALVGLNHRYRNVAIVDEESGIILRGFTFQPIVEPSKNKTA